MSRGFRDKGASSRPSSRKAESPSAKHAQRQRAQAAAPVAAEETEHLLDERTRRDIWGVVCVVAAIVFLLIAFTPSSGLVTRWMSDAVHMGLGVGAYVLPVVLALIGVSLFLKREGQQMPTRVALGLALLFVSLLALLALYTPQASPQTPDVLFLRQNLVSQGGYVGAGVAWVLLVLFGRGVSTVIVVGVMVIGLLVVGVSVRTFVDKIREHRERAREEDEEFSMPAVAVRHDDPADWRRAAAGQGAPADPGVTQVLGQDGRAAKADKGEGVLGRVGQALRGGKGQKGGDDSAPDASSGKTHVLTKSEMASQALTRRLGHKPEVSPDSAAATRVISPASKRAGQPASKAKASGDAPKATSRGAGVHDTGSKGADDEQGFRLPDIGILNTTPADDKNGESAETLRDTAALLQETLSDFGLDVDVVGWVAGPTVTLFKIDLPAGVRVSRIMNLQDDIALALAAQGVRIFAPIPNTNYVGIEVPNVKRQNVLLGDVLPAAKKGPLQVAIGKDVEGHPIVADLAKMPHLLIGGTTGSGKSVAINAMIMSILMRSTPDQVRFIMIDPKRVEFAPYNGIPNLYVPVVTETKEAASALSWAVAEMERRLKVFSQVGARNIEQYNAKVAKGDAGGEGPEGAQGKLPYIVIVIDELSDLMMNVGKEVEFSISRLAQLARAAGIHMIVATQRPSANVVTGLIKANITNRIAFNVASGTDSRVILDQTGAENLIGLGDMLFSRPEYPKPVRIQGCFVSESEIEQTVKQLKDQGEPDYHKEILVQNTIGLGDTDPAHPGEGSEDDDPLLWEAAEIVVSSKLGSTSNLQRRLKVGYSRAGRIMDMLEDKGVVGPPNGSRPREVLVDEMELESIKAFERNDQAEDS